MNGRIAALLAGALLLAGCHRESKNDKSAKEEKPASAAGGDQSMKLDGQAQQRAGLRFQTVARRSVSGFLYSSGRIAVNEERTAHVGVITDGRITELAARVGDTVRKGQVLGRFHSHDVHEAVAAFEIALADLKRRKNAAAYAQVQRDRYRRLFDIKSASRQEVEQSEAALRRGVRLEGRPDYL